MKPPSIALRLALGLSIAMALLWIGAAAISVGVMQNKLFEAYDDSLRQSAFRLLPLAVHDLRERDHPPGRLTVSEDREDIAADEDLRRNGVIHDASFTYFVRDDRGELVLRDEHAPDTVEIGKPSDGFGELDGRRTFSLTDPRTNYSIVILELSDRRVTALRDSAAAVGMPLLALIPLIAAAVWFSMRLAMRPLESLRRDISQRDGRNLEPLRADGHPAELTPIAEAVAGLIERLKAALDAERAFAARSAHELRTPLAGALAQTQQLKAELADKPGVERVRSIEEALKRLSRLSEKLLQLARIEAGFARTDHETDMLPVLTMVARDINANTVWRNRLEFEAEATTSLPAAIDPDAFAIVVRNLAENGLKHGDPTTPVQLRVAADGCIHIQNEGPPLDAAALDRLGQPFVRGDTSAEGSGLGLSIARGILEQAGGHLTLVSPIAGSGTGFEAIIALPRSG